MSIFDNLFGNRQDYKMPEIPTTKVDAKAKEEELNRGLPCYQVGYTADNRVTLRLGSEFSSTLTMTPEGVRHLIRQLEAAIPEYEVPDSLEENEDEE